MKDIRLFVLAIFAFVSCVPEELPPDCKSCSNHLNKINNLFSLNSELDLKTIFLDSPSLIESGEALIEHRGDLYFAYTENNKFEVSLIKNFNDTVFRSTGRPSFYSEFYPKFNGRIYNDKLFNLNYNSTNVIPSEGPGLLIVDLLNNQTEYHALPGQNYFSFFKFDNKIFFIDNEYLVSDVYFSLVSKSVEPVLSDSFISVGDKIVKIFQTQRGDYIIRSIDGVFLHELLSLEDKNIAISEINYGLSAKSFLNEDTLFLINANSDENIDLFSITNGLKIGEINHGQIYSQIENLWVVNDKIFLEYDLKSMNTRIRDKAYIKIIDIQSNDILDVEYLITNPDFCERPKIKDIKYIHGEYLITGDIKCIERI